MKLKKLFWNWTNAVETFPVSHILLVTLTIIWILQIEWIIDLDSPDIILSLILTFIISCYWPLFLIHSNIKNKNLINRTLQIWSIILWWIYYILLYNTDLDNLTYSEWLLYLRIIPLTLLWIPLIIAIFHRKNGSKIRFSWTNLFISIVFWWIAWSIIRWWISGALASIEALFDVDIDSDLYADIWFISEILLAGSFVFNFYLIFSENLNKKHNFEIQPSRLRKIFWSFIFLPLALIYLTIFATYWIKILITWIWPKWIIVRLWIWYFTLWIVSSYLIYPDKTKVHEIINKILYVSFILMSFMMIWAIVKRINQYWITINRCFVCYIIAFIIIFSALSLIFTNKRLLSFVSTLWILGFLSVYGRPINVNNISFNSQLNRLETLLSEQNITLPLNEWTLKDTDEESTKLIIWTLDWLVENYNKDKIINKIINFEYEDRYRSSRYDIREFLGVNTDYDYYYPTHKYRNYNQYNQNGELIDVVWFSKLYNFEKYNGDTENLTLKLNIENQNYEFDLSNYIDELKEKSDAYEWKIENKEILWWPALILEKENYKLVVTWFYLEESTTWETKFINIRWYILFK